MIKGKHIGNIKFKSIYRYNCGVVEQTETRKDANFRLKDKEVEYVSILIMIVMLTLIFFYLEFKR